MLSVVMTVITMAVEVINKFQHDNTLCLVKSSEPNINEMKRIIF